MTGVDNVFTIAGWVLVVVEAVLLVRERRATRRERETKEKLLKMLDRSVPDNVTPAGSLAEREERLRGMFVVAASYGRTFGTVLTEARRTGAVDDEVRDLATRLRDEGLLAFDDPLEAGTTIALNL